MMRSMENGLIFLLLVLLGVPVFGNVRRETEEQYRQAYLNKALFLKIPIHGARQVIHVREEGMIMDRSNIAERLRFKVGEQVRITEVKFSGASVDFEVASIDLNQRSRITYQFLTPLSYTFPQKELFDDALDSTFTEGISYEDIDAAKEDFIKNQFDHLIDQFALTTETSPEFVIQAISEMNPRYQQAQREIEAARDRASKVEQTIEEERQLRQKLQAELEQIRGRANQAGSRIDALTAELSSLQAEKSTIEKEASRLQQSNRQYERQIAQLEEQIAGVAQKLDIEVSNRDQLGASVADLNRSIDSLKSDRNSLSENLNRVSRQLEGLQNQNRSLSEELESAQRRNSQLSGDLDSLTSNRDSLEAQFLELRREKESLERARALEAALSQQTREEQGESGVLRVSDIYLNEQRIARLEVKSPSRAGESGSVLLEVLSPDTIQFTPEERELYEALGEEWQVEAGWRSWSGMLEPVLLEGESKQAVPRRESAVWSWQFQGDLEEPDRLVLDTKLASVDGHPIALALQEFEVQPTGIVPWLKQQWSLPSLLAGLLLALAVAGIFVSRRGKRSRPAPAKRAASAPARDYAPQKKL